MRIVHVICGSTYPFQPEVHTTKRGAHRRAAEMRREIRKTYGRGLPSCGVRVESRPFDVAHDVLIGPKYPAFGDKRDYPKIDVYRSQMGKDWHYVHSTTWCRTCREAVERARPLVVNCLLKAHFAKER